MSIGAAFHALDRYRLRALVIDPSTVSGFLNTASAKGGPHDSQTVEQAWDVVRTLMYRRSFFGTPWTDLTQQVMRGPSPWTVGEREIFAAFVSRLNQCVF